MSDGSTIEWTEATWNPTRGCKKISPGCKHCYAERFAERFRGVPGHAYERGFEPRFVVDQLGLPLSWRKPRTIFVDSMSDLFQDGVTDEQIAAVFGVMSLCPHHTFQVLTKRADRMRRWFQWVSGDELPPNVTPIRPRMARDATTLVRMKLAKLAPQLLESPLVERRRLAGRIVWPLSNVWLGVSVEDQEYAERRIPHLLRTPAAIRFVSYEPALGPVDFQRLAGGPEGYALTSRDGLACLDWIIMGGESGPGARAMGPEWVRSVRDQCAEAGVDFFFKQWGGILKKRAGREIDGRTHDAMPRRA